jgi:hypothetical protein
LILIENRKINIKIEEIDPRIDLTTTVLLQQIPDLDVLKLNLEV